MRSKLQSQRFAGAMTLLHDCVDGRAGDRLLIVSEPDGSGFYDDLAPRITAAAGRAMGMLVYQTESGCFLATAEDRDVLQRTLRGFDHIVFFSRVGDQIRFDADESMPSATMCYTLDIASLNSDFGTACYHGLCEIRNLVERAIEQACHIEITCPLGTHLEGYPDWPSGHAGEVRIKRFPMLVPRPIPTAGFAGHVALSRFLVGTGSHFYEPYQLLLDDTAFASVQDNRICGFHGSPETVRQIESHYARVSQQYAIEPMIVHSWHAGIHPGCHFRGRAEADLMRWSGSAFGNPRLLHFHTCGDYAPGEICWNILDPTIRLDGLAAWEAGYLHPERLSGADRVLDAHPHLWSMYQEPQRDIGLS